MGITRCGRHKRSASGAKRHIMQKKRKNMMGRQPTNTKIGEYRVNKLRTRGGNHKMRVLRLESGEFSMFTSKDSSVPEFKATSKVSAVSYHPSNNELVRTNTLTKGSIIKIDAEPFLESIKKVEIFDKLLSNLVTRGYIFAVITDRPGQVGSINGHVLQGDELAFYNSKLKKGKIELE